MGSKETLKRVSAFMAVVLAVIAGVAHGQQHR